MIDLLALKRSTLPLGNRKFGGGGGGDGGYADRQASLLAGQDEAINSVNSVFGKGNGAPIYATVTGTRPSGVVSPISGNVEPESYTERVVTGYDTAARDKAAAERDKLYSTITQDSSARLLDKLAKDRDVAQRGTSFQLARQGLAGGSSDIDQNAQLLDKFNEGTLEAGNAALAAGNGARSADETTRVNLINNIRNGMSGSDATSAAYAGLTNNANTARDSALATNIGGFFDDINNANAQRQYNQALQTQKSMYGSGGGVTSSGNNGGNNGRIF